MLLYVPDGHQNRADNHESFPGSSVLEQHFDSGFESAPVRLSACDAERSINTITRNLISGGTLDRKPTRNPVSLRNASSK